jgi:hypothetical protein
MESIAYPWAGCQGVLNVKSIVDANLGQKMAHNNEILQVYKFLIA